MMTIDWAVLGFLMIDMMGEPPWHGQNWDLGMEVGLISGLFVSLLGLAHFCFFGWVFVYILDR